MGEKYLFVKAFHKVSKEKKSNYGIAYVLLINDSSCDLINCLIEDSQVDFLNKNALISNFKIEDYMKLSYNSFKKQFELKINYGLKN